MWLQNEQQIETTKENQIKLARENAFEAERPYLAPQNMFKWAILERLKCCIGLLFNENRKQQEQKRK